MFAKILFLINLNVSPKLSPFHLHAIIPSNTAIVTGNSVTFDGFWCGFGFCSVGASRSLLTSLHVTISDVSSSPETMRFMNVVGSELTPCDLLILEKI